MSIIFVEIPHQMPPVVWTADDWQDAAARSVQRCDGQQPKLEHWTRESVIDCWGEWDEAPDELRQIIETHGEAVEVVWRPGVHEYVAPDDAPTMAEVVKEWIGHDLHAARFLEGPEDVAYFLSTYDGHQAIPARLMVEDEARKLGWWNEPRNDMDESCEP